MYHQKRLLDIIRQETNGEIFKGNYTSAYLSQDERTYCDSGYDSDSASESMRVWKSSAESPKRSQTKKYVDLLPLSKRYASGNEQVLSYFLDGSRQIIKAGEILYWHFGGINTVYPIMAAQIGVGYCRRVNKKLIPERIADEIVIALPNVVDSSKGKGFFESMALKLSQGVLIQKLNLKVTAILKYVPGKNSPLQDTAAAVIHSRMLEQEQALTEELTQQRKLNQENFLVKNGSLEYISVNTKKSKFNAPINNYRWVLGISKRFTPEIRFNSQDRANSGYIADTPVNHRTLAARFESLGGAEFAVWYIRLYDRSRTNSAFDGLIRVEKMLVTQSEKDKGLDSELIDTLSAYILNERNPVCYGLYPVYLTESYIKSRYLGTESFWQLF